MTKRKVVVSKKLTSSEALPLGYREFIVGLKNKIRSAQLRAAISVNRSLIRLYWEIGGDIIQKQEKEDWESQVIEKIARDLQNEFPGIEGFSRSNLFGMRAFLSVLCNCRTACATIRNPSHIFHSLGG